MRRSANAVVFDRNGFLYAGKIKILADAARKEAGFLYHDLIVWDQNDQRSLVLLGYPSVFYVNVNHTFLVVLRKPPKGKGK